MKVKVLTINISSCIDADRKFNWKHGAELIRQAHPDVVAVEEVCVNEAWNRTFDMPKTFSDYLGMTTVFARACSRDGVGDYGVMALSPHPIACVEKIFLPHHPGSEQRVCLVCRVEMEKPFYFLVTHLSYMEEYPESEENRLQSIDLISETVKRKNYRPAILSGDFNSTCHSKLLELVRRDWDVDNDANPDAPTHEAGEMLDYICTTPRDAIPATDFQIGTVKAGDHFPVSAVVSI